MRDIGLHATCATPGLYVLEARADELAAVAREYVERLAESIAPPGGAAR